MKPHKATVSPVLHSRTVLTNSPWEFVSLWLTRNKKTDALFYWNQAREFARVSAEIAISSAPLLHYYSFMNAVKALLASKGQALHEQHGISREKKKFTNRRIIDINNEAVYIQKDGVYPAFAAYLGDAETDRTHTLRELLFNLPFVHRTYCLTYASQQDMYFPLKEPEYVWDRYERVAYFRAKLSEEFATNKHIRQLPKTMIYDKACPLSGFIRSHRSVALGSPTVKGEEEVGSLVMLNRELRNDLQCITGSQTLWYVKALVPGAKRLNRSVLTATLAAMHRLSEYPAPLEIETTPKTWSGEDRGGGHGSRICRTH